MELVKCRQIENCPNCFARDRNGGCKALGNTDFGTKKCPFYKTEEQQRKELEKIRERG